MYKVPYRYIFGLSSVSAYSIYYIHNHNSTHIHQPQHKHSDNQGQFVGSWKFHILKSLPMRELSRLWGYLNSEYELPLFMRKPIYLLWTKTFNCQLEEMEGNLDDYKNLNQFFTRALKDSVRPISSSFLVSPVDGQVLHFGPVHSNSVEQVKGVTYSLDAFLGTNEFTLDPKEKFHNIPFNPENQLYHCVLYLSPGDYHRFHSPTEWRIEKLKHFSGHLFSVSPSMVKMLEGLFVLNERMVMLGQWPFGFFSMTAVGATNVGSIELTFDQTFKTNRKIMDALGQYDEKCLITQKVLLQKEKKFYLKKKEEHSFHMHQLTDSIPVPDSESETSEPIIDDRGKLMTKGQELGKFNLGSTIVLVFEAPKNFRFCIEQGQKIKYGSTLGVLAKDQKEFSLQSHPPFETIQELEQHTTDDEIDA